MNRTAKLLFILCVLVVVFCLYLYYIDFDGIMSKVDNFIDSIQSHEVIVPSDTKNHRDYSFKTVSETNDFNPKSMDDLKKIYYTVLNNGWNEFTFYCDKDVYPTCAEDVKELSNNNEYVTLINNYVSPYNSYEKFNTLITNDKTVYIKIDKLYSESEIKTIDEKIDSIFTELNINKVSPTLDDIKAIHNYLIRNVTYDTEYTPESEDKSPSKAFYALLRGQAICSGYSDSFSLMMDKLNIPNFKVSTIDHVWNVIYFNNQWFHVDVTWDDDEVNNNNYYNFFMINTNDLLSKDKLKHSFDTKSYLELS